MGVAATDTGVAAPADELEAAPLVLVATPSVVSVGIGVRVGGTGKPPLQPLSTIIDATTAERGIRRGMRECAIQP